MNWLDKGEGNILIEQERAWARNWKKTPEDLEEMRQKVKSAEEWPMPRSELIFTFYADHAYQTIKKNFKNGELLKYGKTFWY